MKKGFTLMEVLAVLLLIAVVLTLAVPTLRAVRQDSRNQQAKAAALKIAEAINTFYVETKGIKINTFGFNPTTATGSNLITTAPSQCTAGASGVPATQSQSAGIGQLFACGYLETKDFTALPYYFGSADKATGASVSCQTAVSAAQGVQVVAYGEDGAGSRYQKDKGCIYVDMSRRVSETYE